MGFPASPRDWSHRTASTEPAGCLESSGSSRVRYLRRLSFCGADPASPAPRVSSTCQSLATPRGLDQSSWDVPAKPLAVTAERNIGSETTGSVPSLPPRRSFAMSVSASDWWVADASNRARREPAQATFPGLPVHSLSQPAFQHYQAVHIRMHQGDTTASHAFPLREGSEARGYFWPSVQIYSLDDMARLGYGSASTSLVGYLA